MFLLPSTWQRYRLPSPGNPRQAEATTCSVFLVLEVVNWCVLYQAFRSLITVASTPTRFEIGLCPRQSRATKTFWDRRKARRRVKAFYLLVFGSSEAKKKRDGWKTKKENLTLTRLILWWRDSFQATDRHSWYTYFYTLSKPLEKIHIHILFAHTYDVEKNPFCHFSIEERSEFCLFWRKSKANEISTSY